MKLIKLMEKAETGHSNTMYDNIDNINGEFKVFEMKNKKKVYHFSSTILNRSIEKMKEYAENGFPILKTEKRLKNCAKNSKNIIKNRYNGPIDNHKIKKLPKRPKMNVPLKFKSQKYYNRVDPIVYDPSMTYIPKQK